MAVLTKNAKIFLTVVLLVGIVAKNMAMSIPLSDAEAADSNSQDDEPDTSENDSELTLQDKEQLFRKLKLFLERENILDKRAFNPQSSK